MLQLTQILVVNAQEECWGVERFRALSIDFHTEFSHFIIDFPDGPKLTVRRWCFAGVFEGRWDQKGRVNLLVVGCTCQRNVEAQRIDAAAVIACGRLIDGLISPQSREALSWLGRRCCCYTYIEDVVMLEIFSLANRARINTEGAENECRHIENYCSSDSFHILVLSVENTFNTPRIHTCRSWPNTNSRSININKHFSSLSIFFSLFFLIFCFSFSVFFLPLEIYFPSARFFSLFLSIFFFLFRSFDEIILRIFFSQSFAISTAHFWSQRNSLRRQLFLFTRPRLFGRRALMLLRWCKCVSERENDGKIPPKSSKAEDEEKNIYIYQKIPE